jgi:hypothetical protein
MVGPPIFVTVAALRFAVYRKDFPQFLSLSA